MIVPIPQVDEVLLLVMVPDITEGAGVVMAEDAPPTYSHIPVSGNSRLLRPRTVCAGSASAADFQAGRSGNLVARTVVICSVFGLFFSPIFAYFEQVNILHHSWYGVIVPGTFGLIFSTVRSAGRNIQDTLVRAVLAGVAAGVAANMLWVLLRFLENTQPIDYSHLIFGLEFGVVLGLVIYLFHNWMPWSTVVRSLSMAAIGGATFVVLGLLNNIHHFQQAPDGITVYPMLALICVVATIGVALGLDVSKAPTSLSIHQEIDMPD